MCTAITLRAADGSMLMARTMDFSYPLSPRAIKVPAGSDWSSCLGTTRYRVGTAYQGIGQNADAEGRRSLFADGVNDRGLCVAALYFPGYASYDNQAGNPTRPGGAPIGGTVAAYEIVPFLLGMCADVRQAVSVLRGLRIIGVPDPVTGIAAPLHWMLTDASGACVTAEKTADGLHLYQNPVGVLTNSPDFGWHMTNLRNYIPLRAQGYEPVSWNGTKLAPFGQGSGSLGLPGDFAPPSRFVRAAWLKTHAAKCRNFSEAHALARCILGNVSLPKGCVVTERGSVDYTQYTVFFNLSEPECILEQYGA